MGSFANRGWVLSTVLLFGFLMFMPSAAMGQSVANGNFEGGFTSGSYGSVGNNWTAWRQANYTNATLADGTDYYYGAHSQKFNMLQPPVCCNLDMGIYQLVNTANGGTYTFSLKLRTQQGNESYSGEHLNVFMGLDPYGGTYLNSLDIQWHEMSNSRNVWQTQSYQVTAQGPITTIFIKAWRKVATGGSGYVWIDDVTVSGPAPDPTYTPVPTVTPSPTIPAPVGPEKIVNGGFDTFTSGLANNWSSWSSAGSGYWKQSTRLGKAGGGNYAGVNGWYEDAVAMQAKTYLLGTGFGPADSFANENSLDDAIIIGRQNIDDKHEQIYFGDYQAVATWLTDLYTMENGYHPRVDAWCGMNEPDWGTISNWNRVQLFEMDLAQKMRARGLKTVAINLSVGSPGDMNRILNCKDLFQYVDFFGYHSYGGVADDLMVTNINQNDPLDWALRCRQMQGMYAQRGWRWPATVYTEGTTYGPWHGGWSSTRIRDDIIAMRGYMDQDRWNTGLTIFTVGSGGGWSGWDITGYGIASPVGVANMDNPADRTSGLYSQQWGVGKVHCTDNTCDNNGVLTGGIVQAVSGLTSGQTYRLGFDFKWEYKNGVPGLTFRCGIDWTGQTSNPNAGTINWSNDLIAQYNLPSEIFQYHYVLATSTGTSASIWFKSSQSVSTVPYRINLDTVSFQQVSGTPPPTNTPAPATSTPTRTPTPTNTQVPACTPLTVDDYFNNAGTFDANWTAFGTSPSRYIKSEYWCSHTAQYVEIQSTNGGYRRTISHVAGSSYTLTMDTVRGNNTRYVRIDSNGGTNPAVYDKSWTNSGGAWVCETGISLTGTVGASGAITVFLGTTTNGQYEHMRVVFNCPPASTATPTKTNTPLPTNTPTNTPLPTSTPTNTPLPTNTPTNTPLPTSTPTNTPTKTPTRTPTNTPTRTPTPTNTPVGPIAQENFESMPTWNSTFNAAWGGAATWSIVAGGQSGNALQATRSNDGSSAVAKVYTVPTSTNITISGYMRSGTGTGYWAEFAYKMGSYTAQDFDQNAGTWTMIKKFSNSGTNGNGNVWTQYSSSTFSTGSNTQVSIGYKLGRSGGTAPTVQWDTFRIQ